MCLGEGREEDEGAAWDSNGRRATRMGILERVFERRQRRRSEKKVEQAVNRAVREYAQAHGTNVRSLNTVLLRFSTARLGFLSLQSAFETADLSNSGSLSLPEAKKALKSLQWELSNDSVEKVFTSAGVPKSYICTFSDFVLFAALAVLTAKPDPNSHTTELEEAISIAVDAFVFFDQDGTGTIKKDEVSKAICSSPHSAHHPHTLSIGELRFDEMYWDKDGVIDFTRFMYSFTEWVGLEEDDDGDRDFDAHIAAQRAAQEERRRSVERRSLDGNVYPRAAASLDVSSSSMSVDVPSRRASVAAPKPQTPPRTSQHNEQKQRAASPSVKLQEPTESDASRAEHSSLMSPSTAVQRSERAQQQQ